METIETLKTEIIETYISPRRPIIPTADFDILKTHKCPVCVLGDFNGNYRQLGIDKLMMQENN